MIRAGAAWAIFAIGHVLSRLNRVLDFGWLYAAYSRTMGLSDRVQGPTGRGPWSAALEASCEREV